MPRYEVVIRKITFAIEHERVLRFERPFYVDRERLAREVAAEIASAGTYEFSPIDFHVRTKWEWLWGFIPYPTDYLLFEHVDRPEMNGELDITTYDWHLPGGFANQG